MHASATTVRDQPCIRIEADGASALIALHGAHVLSWIPADGRERLFLSERAAFDGQTAIRGGIPVIFPQFSERGLLPKHGFVRIRPWTFAGLDQDDAVFALDGDGSEPAWPHPFRARLRIAMTATTFAATLDVANTGDAPFAFTAALHTYLRVDDIAQVVIEGLQGCDYEDTANGGTLHRQHDHDVRFAGETDRIFLGASRPLSLNDGAGQLGIAQDGFTDVVVWNPWADKGAALADLSPDGWRRMLCVEAAVAGAPLTVRPGEEWYGRQKLMAD